MFLDFAVLADLHSDRLNVLVIIAIQFQQLVINATMQKSDTGKPFWLDGAHF